MFPPTKPGQRCKIIGGRAAFNGHGKSGNMGKIVTTLFLHAEKAGKIEQENVWRCRAQEGQLLATYDGVGPEADFLECWLEVLPDDDMPKIDVQQKELQHE